MDRPHTACAGRCALVTSVSHMYNAISFCETPNRLMNEPFADRVGSPMLIGMKALLVAKKEVPCTSCGCRLAASVQLSMARMRN